MYLLARAHRFLLCEDGPTATEYAVMLAVIVFACIAIVATLGATVSSKFSGTYAGTKNS